MSVERTDEFDGEVQVDITGLPPGFTVSTPLVIQAGHAEAKGTINAALDAPPPAEANSKATKVTATAMVQGKTIIKDVNNFGTIKLGDKPKLFVSLQPYVEPTSTNSGAADTSSILPGKP